MPQKVICSKCGTVLYEGNELKSPDEIYEMHKGSCPYCGKILNQNFTNIKIEPNPEKYSGLYKR